MDITAPSQPPNIIRAQKALILYGEGHRTDLVQQHDILLDEAGEAYLGPGSSVTASVLNSLQRMNQVKEQLTLLPPEVVAVSRRQIAWVVPGRKRKMALHSANPAIQAFDGVTLAQPHLLFIAGPGVLKVFALDSDERPTGETPLYRAPFMNMFGNNQMCRGSVPLPAEPDIGNLAMYEDLFFLSNSTGGAVQIRGFENYAELLRTIKKTGTFDPAWLVPTGHTLAQEVGHL